MGKIVPLIIINFLSAAAFTLIPTGDPYVPGESVEFIGVSTLIIASGFLLLACITSIVLAYLVFYDAKERGKSSAYSLLPLLIGWIGGLVYLAIRNNK